MVAENMGVMHEFVLWSDRETGELKDIGLKKGDTVLLELYVDFSRRDYRINLNDVKIIWR